MKRQKKYLVFPLHNCEQLSIAMLRKLLFLLQLNIQKADITITIPKGGDKKEITGTF